MFVNWHKASCQLTPWQNWKGSRKTGGVSPRTLFMFFCQKSSKYVCVGIKCGPNLCPFSSHFLQSVCLVTILNTQLCWSETNGRHLVTVENTQWVSSSLPLLVLFWPMHVHIHSAQKQLGFCVALFVEYLFTGTRWQLRSPWWQCALTQCHNIHHWSGDQVQVIRWKTKKKTTAKTTTTRTTTTTVKTSVYCHIVTT